MQAEFPCVCMYMYVYDKSMFIEVRMLCISWVHSHHGLMAEHDNPALQDIQQICSMLMRWTLTVNNPKNVRNNGLHEVVYLDYVYTYMAREIPQLLPNAMTPTDRNLRMTLDLRLLLIQLAQCSIKVGPPEPNVYYSNYSINLNDSWTCRIRTGMKKTILRSVHHNLHSLDLHCET